jgi:hypothetical protein
VPSSLLWWQALDCDLVKLAVTRLCLGVAGMLNGKRCKSLISKCRELFRNAYEPLCLAGRSMACRAIVTRSCQYDLNDRLRPDAVIR